jgi:predicted DCC family thiol-disulfide oxidoreductase YuxK
MAHAQESGSDGAHRVVLFDGVCVLCSRFVRFLIKRDRRGVLRFAALQGPAGNRLRAAHPGAPPAGDSVLYRRYGTWYAQSDAVLRIIADLGGAWRLALVLLLVPGALRDTVYNRVARSRYRWFGRTDDCLVPGPAVRERFLD